MSILTEVAPNLHGPCRSFEIGQMCHLCAGVGWQRCRASPVIATDEVGALPHMLEYEAGVRWGQGESLPGLVAHLAMRRQECQASAARMAAALGERAYRERLMQIYEGVRERKQGSHSLSAGGIRAT